MPEHVDSWPAMSDRSNKLWHVNAHDAFDDEVYPVVNNSDSLEEAELLARAFRRQLEKSHAFNQISSEEDRVFIVKPGESHGILSGSAES